jgi:arginine exporter protein ArgO
MNQCVHNLNALKAVVCSGPFKFRCSDCGVLLVRRHSRTEALVDLLFCAMGIPVLVLFILAIMWFPLVVLGTALVFLATYAWDTSATPLSPETKEEFEEEKRKSIYALVVFGIILIFLLVSLVYET